MRILIAIALLLTLVPARGEVYRWTDDKGVVHYGDKPPKEGVKPVELPPLQTYSPSAAAAPATPRSESANPAPPAKASIRIAAPADDETIRDAGTISMTVDAALQPGQGLVYFLDGVQQNKVATPSSAWL